MAQKRLYFKIGDACKALGIQPYVLRYWETEFAALAPNKSKSGQRVYSEEELAIIRCIKELLYDEGYTIAGAKKRLESELADPGLLQAPAEPEPDEAPEVAEAVEAGGELDTAREERIKTLRRGIAEALAETRAILSLLDSRPSP